MPATLSGIVPEKYLTHTLLLVKGIRILLGTHITQRDLQVAHSLLELYIKFYEQCYGMHTHADCGRWALGGICSESSVLEQTPLVIRGTYVS